MASAAPPVQTSRGEEDALTIGSTVRAAMAKGQTAGYGIIVDSGASDHMTGNRALFRGFVQSLQRRVDGIANALVATGVGSGVLPIPGQLLHLSRLHYVPGLTTTLISVSALVEDDAICRFHKVGTINTLTLSLSPTYSRNFRAIRGLYPIPMLPCTSTSTIPSALFESNVECAGVRGFVSCARTGSIHGNSYIGATALGTLLHRRLGHISLANARLARRLREAFGVAGLERHDTASCDACMRAKMKQSFSRAPPTRPATRPLERVHWDFKVGLPRASCGSTGFALFVDEKTDQWWFQPFKHKSEIIKMLAAFKAAAENHFRCRLGELSGGGGETDSELMRNMEGNLVPFKLAGLRSDGEVVNTQRAIVEWCRTHGIRHELSAPYCQWQNGTAERGIQTVWQGSEAMRKYANAPSSLWPFSGKAFTDIRNKLAMGTEERSPWEQWNMVQVPLARRIRHMRIWGCKCYVLVPPQLRSCQSDKARVGVFLGYSDQSKAYMDLKTRRIIVSPNVVFDESIMPFASSSPAPVHSTPIITSPALAIPTALPPSRVGVNVADDDGIAAHDESALSERGRWRWYRCS